MTYISNLGLAFAQVARRFPDNVAFKYPDSGISVSYAEVSKQVDQVARVMHARGLRQGDVVALLHDKSPMAYASMLACLRLGVIYTVLDPLSPWERVHKILQRCQPRLVVNAFGTLPFGDALLAAFAPNILHLGDLGVSSADTPLPDFASVSGASPAYIMFTSGSTGLPKGAVISHANLLWFIQWAQDRFRITDQDLLTNVNPIYFDNSVFDFYTALFAGATLVPFTHDQLKDTRQLVRLVDAAACTIWFSVPSLLVYLLTTRSITQSNFQSLRKIIFGGEGFPKAKLKELYTLYADHADLENVYGPTECTCICSARTIEEADFEDMTSLAPLGTLAQNFDCEILSADSVNPDFGELFLKGPQVGLGYYNDAERTARQFVQNPRHGQFSDIGYRTGDLVSRDAQGELHFKGRADFQIKHLGYRIELEEIEAAFNSLAAVAECAVIYASLGAGMGQIIAYVCTTQEVSSDDLHVKVAAIIPNYMLPKRILILDALPKNANGKTDRMALQRPP